MRIASEILVVRYSAYMVFGANRQDRAFIYGVCGGDKSPSLIHCTSWVVEQNTMTCLGALVAQLIIG